MKKRFVLMLYGMLAGVVNISAQEFFNLTASEVKIDSVLPFFSRIYDLDAHGADSAYSVTIAYPEFIDCLRQISSVIIRLHHLLCQHCLS